MGMGMGMGIGIGIVSALVARLNWCGLFLSNRDAYIIIHKEISAAVYHDNHDHRDHHDCM